jgi:hypothetical protein
MDFDQIRKRASGDSAARASRRKRDTDIARPDLDKLADYLETRLLEPTYVIRKNIRAGNTEYLNGLYSKASANGGDRDSIIFLFGFKTHEEHPNEYFYHDWIGQHAEKRFDSLEKLAAFLFERYRLSSFFKL